MSQSKREMLREKRKQQKRQKTITFLIIAAVAVLLIGAMIILPKLLTQGTKYENTDKFSIGDPNAPVKVVEFSNYGCSHCKNFSESTEADFVKTYVDTGEVYFTYVNIPYNDAGYLAAAEASYCAAEQNMFYEYKEQLFTYVGQSDSYSIENLITYASTAGLDTDKFTSCMESDTYAQSYLDDYAYAESIGLQGTPSFLINGSELVYSSQLYAQLDELLQN
jgi:protein-disulfide isomerase